MLVRKSSDGYISIGLKKVSRLAEDSGAVRALKKPLPIFARRIDEVFAVETTEDLMKARDWLMQDVSGELYICSNGIFRTSYDILN